MLPIPDTEKLWLSWTGMETDLIFKRGIDLPGFASFPLLETESGQALVRDYYLDQVKTARDAGCGVCLESLTWMANRNRAGPLGYDVTDLTRINRAAIALMAGLADGNDICLSAQIGPAGDGYQASRFSVDAARAYHAEQIEVLAGTKADILSAFTLGAVDEATGIVLAASDVGKPVCIAFTVETDSCLPDGTPLAEAIDRVDQATGGTTAYFLVNCAHPDHLGSALDGNASLARLAGVVANASRKSHAELDEATELDEGDPSELGQQLAVIRQRFPQMTVLGGCCGTDMRHLAAIGKAARENVL